MREIKFRAWMKDAKLMIEDVVPIHNEVYGHYCKDFERDTDRYLKLENPEIMQYTGLKDRNGKEIFEGDIASHRDYECFGYVVFSGDESAFAFLVITGSNNKGPTTEFEWLYDYADGLEIIGNIHENPELLEGD